jgi:putative transposase
MMEVDARTASGPRHGRGKDRTAHRWGKTKGKIGFHGGKVEIALRGFVASTARSRPSYR